MIAGMIGGRFQIGIAAGLCALALGVGVAVGKGIGSDAAAIYQAEREAQQNDASPTLPAVSEEQEQASPADYARHCERPQTREEADLCQQWRMAEATEELTTLAERQLVATYWEIGALIGTLVLGTIAVIVSINSARAARDQVALSVQTLIADQRAWIGADLEIESVETDADSIGIGVIAHIRNIGKTPAHGVHTSIGIFVQDDSHDVDAPFALFCAENRKRWPAASRMLLPGDGYPREWFVSGSGILLVVSITRLKPTS